MSTQESPTIGEIYLDLMERQAPRQTLLYQGQEIEAERVNYMSGAVVITPWLDHEADEDLFRDSAGRCYLRRESRCLDLNGETERAATERTLVHHLSVKAAIMWTTMRVNAQTFDLRQDAAGLAELDDHASDLLREHLADNPDHDPRDVVNAALDFFLGEEVGENWHTDGAIAAAKARRLALAGGEEAQ